MPIHDWTRVFPGTVHHFHTTWIARLAESLNAGRLPSDLYALVEQHAAQVNPDVLTLSAGTAEPPSPSPPRGAIAVAEAAPRVSLHMVPEEGTAYRLSRRTLAIRHRSNRRIVALIEVVSPGNKDGAQHLEQLVDKVVAALQRGIHVLVVDLFPPGALDPEGIHGAIWGIVGGAFCLPPDKPLTLASYLAGSLPEAFIETCAVGQSLPEMPLFLSTGWYIQAPLDEAYLSAYRGLPSIVKDVLEGSAPPETDRAAVTSPGP